MPRKGPQAAGWRRELGAALRDKSAKVGVIGLGYVGLPMLVTAARAGFPAVGVDLDHARVDAIRHGRSYISDVTDAVLRESGVRAAGRYSALKDRDVVLICVPTPLDDGNPDLRFIEGAGRGLAKVLRPGVLVILESTTYPGTTEEVLRPILETSGLRAGRDFALAYSPERIDPGREPDHVAKTPKVVGGLTKADGELAARFYRSFVHEVELVSSPREAEMAKLIENTFRHVNIALMNELAILSKDLDVDLWEAIRAAATKPFGFMAFWPGPGVGGHCIAIDPSYLSWRVGQQSGHRLNFVEHAQEVNARMPGFVAQRVAQALNEHGKPVRGSKVLGVGVTYKPDVNDMRESPALAVLERLAAEGATIVYHDPYVPSLEIDGKTLRSKKLTPSLLSGVDVAVVLAAHSAVDFGEVVKHAPLVFDTRGVTRGKRSNVVRL
ncbi:MAG TPA: nucleotide sugar dehydrogenase [Actinomycetota bacterium]|nr:nucleotide sugar dehydrogenase [Actinomycetota bacterium]